MVGLEDGDTGAEDGAEGQGLVPDVGTGEALFEPALGDGPRTAARFSGSNTNVYRSISSLKAGNRRRRRTGRTHGKRRIHLLSSRLNERIRRPTGQGVG